MQEGTPWEVYHQPRNRFVAEFIGAANILEGVVLDVRGDEVHVHLGKGRLVRAALPGGTAAPILAGRTLLCLRPEAVRVLMGEPAPAHANVFPGRVRAAVFEGGRVRYEVDLDGGLVVRADVPNPTGAAPAASGTAVTVAFGGADVHPLGE